MNTSNSPIPALPLMKDWEQVSISSEGRITIRYVAYRNAQGLTLGEVARIQNDLKDTDIGATIESEHDEESNSINLVATVSFDPYRQRKAYSALLSYALSWIQTNTVVFLEK